MSEPNKNVGTKDDPRSAPESGEPKDAGRSRGQVVDPRGDRDAKDRSGGTGEQYEEGRHDAVARGGE